MLDINLEQFYKHISPDKILSKITTRFRGLKPKLVASTIFETLVIAIMGQQVNLTFAGTLKRRIVERFGSRIEYVGKTYYSFPSACRIARIRPATLRAMQFSRQKVHYVLNLAKEVCSGKLDLEALQNSPPEIAVEKLLAIPGIGRWTAEYCLMRGIGHLDSLPAGDTGLQNAVTQFYGFQRRATEEQIRRLGEKWKPYRSLATFYLWYAYSKKSNHSR